jgi:Putative zinc-finger
MVNITNRDAVPEIGSGNVPQEAPQISGRSEVSRTTGRSASCSDATITAGAYLAHELSGVRLEKFVRHIRECDECHDHLLVLELHLNLASRAVPSAGSS